MALDGRDCAIRIHRRLPLRRGANQSFAPVGKRHDGGGGAFPLVIGDDRRHTALHHGHTAIGGAQVNADYLAHIRLSFPSAANKP